MINALGTVVPGVPIHVFTQASRWLLERTIRVPVSIVETPLDTGAVQRDSLSLDEDRTLAEAAAFEHQADERSAALASELRRRDVRVVVCDAPPMACTAAHLAGVPAIVLANFTWDWIYEDFTADPAAPAAWASYADLPARLGARYAQAHAAWRLPMHGGFTTIRTVLDFPWVARRSRLDPADVRQRIGAGDTRPLVLISFGGYGVQGLRLSHHAGAPYRLVISGGAAHPPEALPPDALRLDRDALDARGLRYEDLVAACDVVVSKPGYGIVSECVANDTALLYTDRGRFREYPVMVAELPDVLRSSFLSQTQLTSARWDEEIAAVLAQPARPPALVNGADVAAEMLAAML